jgi:carboxylesterase type B
MGDVSAAKKKVSIQVGGVKVQGFVNPATQVANYLGIQYATIPARYRQAKAIDLAQLDGILDATRYGPRCPQLPITRDNRAHLYEGIPDSSEYPLDELGCLRLNIYVPQGASGPLPVVVWIHGGGFVFGDGNSEYDGNYLVQHSAERGKPIIFVAMNYRLGFFGFLTSKELRAEAEADGETPFVNLAMHDQRVALLWVQRHIQHFGGDPANVTIAGESAGGWSVLAHLRSDVPVCQRGMILSSPNLDFPDPEKVQETFDELVASTGVAADASAEEKLKALRKMESADVVKSILPRFSTPCWDDKWFTYQDGKRPVAGPAPFGPWVKGVVAGATRDEAALFGLGEWRNWTPQQFEDRVKSSFTNPRVAKEMADAYGISSDAPVEKCLAGLIAMATDGGFSSLPYIVAEASSDTSTPVSVYRFAQADTFDVSPLKGYAWHAIDNPFFCRFPAVAGPKADPNVRETANRLSQAIFDLAYGSQPWPAYHHKNEVMVLNGKESHLEEVTGQDRWRKVATSGDLAREKGTWRAASRLLGVRHCSMEKD